MDLTRSHTGTALCCSFPLVRSPHSDSPLLLDRREAGAWADPPAAPSGRTVRGWSPIPARGSLRRVLAAVPLPSDLNRRGTRPRTAAAAPERALLRLSLCHRVPRHPGHRQTVLWIHNSTGDFLVLYLHVHRGEKTRKWPFWSWHSTKMCCSHYVLNIKAFGRKPITKYDFCQCCLLWSATFCH